MINEVYRAAAIDILRLLIEKMFLFNGNFARLVKTEEKCCFFLLDSLFIYLKFLTTIINLKLIKLKT